VANKRTYTDDQLRAAVTASTNWTEVQRALGKTPGSASKEIKAVAARLGLDTSHFTYKQSFRPVARVAMPFDNEIRHGGQSGLSIAARWFLDRGYVVSAPLEPAAYDLVTESDEGLKRVQVKTTRKVEGNGRYTVRVARLLYDATVPQNCNGSRRHVPYDPGSVDYFFVITPKSNFLIPTSVVSGRMTLVLDEKYAAFAV